jgi:hypothetical protein
VEEDNYRYVMNRVCIEETTGADKNRKKKLILAQIGKVKKERAARKKPKDIKEKGMPCLQKLTLFLTKMS